MVSKLLDSLSPTSVVTLAYTLSQNAGFVEYAEHRRELYGVLVVTLDTPSVQYNLFHLTTADLVELYSKLPAFAKMMTNFSITNGILSHENNIKTLTLDGETFQLFVEQTTFVEESLETLWHLLHECLIQNVPLFVGDQFSPTAVEKLRFSDSTPNIVVSMQEENNRFVSRVVHSLDSSIQPIGLFVKQLEDLPDFKEFLMPVGEGYYKVLASLTDQIGINLEDFRQVFSINLLIALLNCREYYKTMSDAAEVLKYYIKMLHPNEVKDSQKGDYTATVYAVNCAIDYSVSKPRVSFFKHPKTSETPEEFKQQVSRVLSEPGYAKVFLEDRLSETCLGFAFSSTFIRLCQVYQTDGFERVLAYDAKVSQRIALYALEIFKWKAAMVYFNEVPTCFGNAFTTKFGVLRLRLGGL